VVIPEHSSLDVQMAAARL